MVISLQHYRSNQLGFLASVGLRSREVLGMKSEKNIRIYWVRLRLFNLTKEFLLLVERKVEFESQP